MGKAAITIFNLYNIILMISVGRITSVTQKTFFLLIIVLFLGILLLLFDVSDWTTDGWTTDGHPTLEESKSKCRGEGRAVICEYTNFCVDSRRGIVLKIQN